MFKHVELTNKEGFVIRGYLDLPENASKIVIFFHGYTGNLTEHNNHFKLLSRELSKLGIASLRMCYTGNGESDGYFYDFNFDIGIADCKQMIDYAFDELKFRNVNLLGFSMGGMFASLLANYRKINKIILWSAAITNYEHWKDNFSRYYQLPNGNGYVSGFEVSPKLYKSISNYDSLAEAKKFKGEVLICQGDKDISVNPDTANKYHDAYQNSKLYIFKDCTHGYEGYQNQRRLFDLSKDFLSK